MGKSSCCLYCFGKPSPSGNGNNDIVNNSHRTNFATVRQQPGLRTHTGSRLHDNPETEEMTKDRKKNIDRLKSNSIKHDQSHLVPSRGGQSSISEKTRAQRSQLQQSYPLSPTTLEIYDRNLKPSPHGKQHGTNSDQSASYQPQRHNNFNTVPTDQTSNRMDDDPQRNNLSNVNQLSKDHVSILVDGSPQNQPNFDSRYYSYQNISGTRSKIKSVSTGDAKTTKRITAVQQINTNSQNSSHVKPNLDLQRYSPSINNSILSNTSKCDLNNEQENDFMSKNEQKYDHVNNLSNIHGTRNERMTFPQPNPVATRSATTYSGQVKQQQQPDDHASKNYQQRRDNVQNLPNVYDPTNERMIVSHSSFITLPDASYTGFNQQQQEASNVLALKYHDYKDDASQSKGTQSMISTEKNGHDPTNDNKIEENNRENGIKQENALVLYEKDKERRDVEDILKKIKHIKEQAMEFSIKIENFTGDGAEHYYIRESLIRLMLKLDELPVEKYETLRKERRSTIKFIYDLCELLNEKK